MLPLLETYLMDNWSRLEIETSKPDKLSFVTMTSCRTKRGNVICLIFKKGEDVPCLIAKFPRYREYSYVIEREYHTLSTVYKNVSLELKDSIPNPIYFGKIGDGDDLLLIEKAFKGKSMRKEITKKLFGVSPAMVEQHLFSIRSWLSQFQKAKGAVITFTQKLLEEYFVEPTNLYLQSYDSSLQEKIFLNHLQEEAKILIGKKFVTTFQHGDFWPGNIIISKDKIGIIDWEFFSENRIPFLDIFWCASMYGMIGHNQIKGSDGTGEDYLNAFVQTYWGSHWLSKRVRGFIKEYWEQEMGLNIKTINLFFSMSLIEWATREYKNYGIHLKNDYYGRKLFNIYLQQKIKPLG